MTNGRDNLKIFSGRANPKLAKGIANYLGLDLGKLTVRKFSDGELWIKFDENIRGVDVFLVQPTIADGKYWLELMITIDAAKRASADRITAVIPYFGYARQDRKDQPRVPISSKLMADLLVTAGANRVLTMDLHSSQIQGFFDVPVDHLYAKNALVNHLSKTISTENLVMLSPDVGGVKVARAWAKHFGAHLAILDKRRPEHNKAKIMEIIGSVDGKDVLIVDDMIDTAGTLTAAAKFAKEKGAKSIVAACTHPLFSGEAVSRLVDSPIDRIIVTDTIALSDEKKFDKLEIITVADEFGEAIKRIHDNESVSALFDID